MRPEEVQARTAARTARAETHLVQTDAWLAATSPEHFPPPADVEPAPE